MRKILTLIAFLFMFCALKAQYTTDSIAAINDIARFKLYPTTNMWTFLKLDTRNGRIWQIQWSLEKENRFETPLSSISLVWDNEDINGRFILYPTTNNYNFILLDQIKGNTYQVQWSQDPEHRVIVPIE